MGIELVGPTLLKLPDQGFETWVHVFVVIHRRNFTRNYLKNYNESEFTVKTKNAPFFMNFSNFNKNLATFFERIGPFNLFLDGCQTISLQSTLPLNHRLQSIIRWALTGLFTWKTRQNGSPHLSNMSFSN